MNTETSNSSRTIKVGILGFGTVGQGTWKHLKGNASFWPKILGVNLEPSRASVRTLDKQRSVEISPQQLTTDSASIVDDPEIDLICELMGGVDEAKELTLRAFAQGKSVVTANKALICEHGEELFQAAEKAGVGYGFEASVAGGIPIIKVLRESLVANEFPLIYGILNGTSNYILTRMEKEGASFEEVLGDARNLGYVEADEALDLDGVDAAHKAVILAYLAHGIWVDINEELNDLPIWRPLPLTIRLWRWALSGFALVNTVLVATAFPCLTVDLGGATAAGSCLQWLEAPKGLHGVIASVFGFLFGGQWTETVAAFIGYVALVAYLAGFLQWLLVRLPRHGRVAGGF